MWPYARRREARARASNSLSGVDVWPVTAVTPRARCTVTLMFVYVCVPRLHAISADARDGVDIDVDDRCPCCLWSKLIVRKSSERFEYRVRSNLRSGAVAVRSVAESAYDARMAHLRFPHGFSPGLQGGPVIGNHCRQHRATARFGLECHERQYETKRRLPC